MNNNWKLTCCECGNNSFSLFRMERRGIAEQENVDCIPCNTPLLHLSKGKTEVRIEEQDDYDYL